jgi:uncharacterized membrane protein YqhA
LRRGEAVETCKVKIFISNLKKSDDNSGIEFIVDFSEELKMKKVENFLEGVIFSSRWIQAPIMKKRDNL